MSTPISAQRKVHPPPQGQQQPPAPATAPAPAQPIVLAKADDEEMFRRRYDLLRQICYELEDENNLLAFRNAVLTKRLQILAHRAQTHAETQSQASVQPQDESRGRQELSASSQDIQRGPYVSSHPQDPRYAIQESDKAVGLNGQQSAGRSASARRSFSTSRSPEKGRSHRDAPAREDDSMSVD